jgi:hypothetical protein
MDKITKENIDKSINRLIEKRTKFQVTAIALIEMLSGDEECKGEMEFYWRICEAILNKDKSLSYDEKKSNS